MADGCCRKCGSRFWPQDYEWQKEHKKPGLCSYCIGQALRDAEKKKKG